MISFVQLSQTKYIIVLSNKIVLILSGGMDSFTLLNHALSKDYEVHCITFDYGQKHIKEIECAEAISKENNLTHIKIKIASTESIFLNSALTSEEVKVPHGSYHEQSMQTTIVPNRNMLFIVMHGSLQGLKHAKKALFWSILPQKSVTLFGLPFFAVELRCISTFFIRRQMGAYLL